MIIYSAGPFDVVHHEADGMYYVHDVRSGEVVSNYYPLAKTANRRARQLAEARPWTLPTLPVGTPETADNYPGVAPKPRLHPRISSPMATGMRGSSSSTITLNRTGAIRKGQCVTSTRRALVGESRESSGWRHTRRHTSRRCRPPCQTAS